jgi:hypothetical protein
MTVTECPLFVWDLVQQHPESGSRKCASETKVHFNKKKKAPEIDDKNDGRSIVSGRSRD